MNASSGYVSSVQRKWKVFSHWAAAVVEMAAATSDVEIVALLMPIDHHATTFAMVPGTCCDMSWAKAIAQEARMMGRKGQYEMARRAGSARDLIHLVSSCTRTVIVASERERREEKNRKCDMK